jgi:hypothetical protein
VRFNNIWEIWGSHSNDDDNVVLLGFDAIWHLWRWTEYTSLKCLYLPTSLHSIKT